MLSRPPLLENFSTSATSRVASSRQALPHAAAVLLVRRRRVAVISTHGQFVADRRRRPAEGDDGHGGAWYSMKALRPSWLIFLDARSQHRIIRRRNGSLSMITSDSAERRTSTPSQKLCWHSTALPRRRNVPAVRCGIPPPAAGGGIPALPSRSVLERSSPRAWRQAGASRKARPPLAGSPAARPHHRLV